LANVDTLTLTGDATLPNSTGDMPGAIDADSNAITVATSADLTGVTVSNYGNLTVDAGQTLDLTAAQATAFNAGTFTNNGTVDVSATGDLSAENLANVTTLTLTGNATLPNSTGDMPGAIDADSNAITVAASADLTGVTVSNYGNLTVDAGQTLTITASQANAFNGNTFTNNGTTVVSDSGEISTSDLTDVNSITLTDSATLTVTQHLLVTVASGTETVTLSNTGTVTAKDIIEAYQLADGVGNDFTTDAVGQTVTGGTGDDTITGVAGNDVILGGDGADTITGGAGEDILTGGGGADTFAFASTDSAADIYSDTDFSGGLTDGDKFVGSFDIIRDFVTGTDKIDIDDSLTFFNTGYTGSEIYVDAGNVKPAMTDVPLGFALLIRGEFNETDDQFVVNFDSGSDTFVYFDVAGTNSGIILDNSILADGNVGNDILGSTDFI
jgi:Ca2+-binding RTX toxin-like protein